MFHWIQQLFDTRDFPERWHCGMWSSLHGWTHIVADTLIWGAYMAIPLAIVYFLLKRREKIPMARVLWLFGLFIVSCGFGHLIEAIIFWFPVYRFAALVKVCTALVSWATVFSLFPIIPKLLNLPGQASLIQRLKDENNERRRVEESLKVIVEIVNQSNDAIISLDPQGTILSWNGGAQRLYGYGPEDAIGRSIELIFVEKKLSLNDLLAAIQKGQEPATTEAIRRSRDGKDIPVSSSVSFIKDAQGRLLRISLMDRDLTEEKVAESKFERVVESSPNGLIMVNEQGRIVLANARCKSLFGYEDEEMLGATIEQLVPPKLRTKHAELRSAFMAAPEERAMARQQELLGYRRDGSQFPVEVGLTPMKTTQGDFVLCTVVDITERKKTEEELLRAKLSAEAATEAKTRFLANMSHEIRTPLNAIIALSSVSLEEEMPAPLRENIQTISRSGDILLNIVNNILDFSKIEAGEMLLDRREFSLAPCIEDALDIVIPNAGDKDIEFVYQYDAEVPSHFFGDPTKIRQILVNLLNNAVKFTDKGEIALSITGAPAEDPNQWRLSFSLEDTGIGIDEDKVAEVLRPFKQANSKVEVAGTGLGLSICHTLIGLMNGHIALAPKSGGVGTVARFDLLLEKSEKSTPHQSMQELQTLIIDDYARNRKQLRERFVAWGAVPVVAETMVEARKLLTRKLKHDLIIVDQRMLLESAELLKELRRLLVTETAILLLSAGRSEPLMSGARVQLVKKPIHWTKLNGLVYELVNRDSSSQDSSQTRSSIPVLGELVPLKILVAEDHPTNQTVLELLLRRLGYDAQFTNDGLEAVMAYKEHRHDVILMDIQMPKLGGVEATKQIRDISGSTEQPWIVALTANVFGTMKSHYLSSGLNDFVGKPLGLQDIYRAFLNIPAIRELSQETLQVSSKILHKPRFDEKVIDWSAMQSLVEVSQMQGPELDQLIVSFHTSFDQTLQSLENAQREQDPDGVQRAAHTLLGSCTTFGAIELGTTLKALNQLEEYKKDRVGDMVSQVSENYARFSKALTNWSGHITLNSPDVSAPNERRSEE